MSDIDTYIQQIQIEELKREIYEDMRVEHEIERKMHSDVEFCIDHTLDISEAVEALNEKLKQINKYHEYITMKELLAYMDVI